MSTHTCYKMSMIKREHNIVLDKHTAMKRDYNPMQYLHLKNFLLKDIVLSLALDFSYLFIMLQKE